MTGRSLPTVNNVTSKLNDDRKISTNSQQYHFKTKRSVGEDLPAIVYFEVTLFTVGVDLPVTV
jgi:hypothetical protein